MPCFRTSRPLRRHLVFGAIAIAATWTAPARLQAQRRETTSRPAPARPAPPTPEQRPTPLVGILYEVHAVDGRRLPLVLASGDTIVRGHVLFDRPTTFLVAAIGNGPTLRRAERVLNPLAPSAPNRTRSIASFGQLLPRLGGGQTWSVSLLPISIDTWSRGTVRWQHPLEVYAHYRGTTYTLQLIPRRRRAADRTGRPPRSARRPPR